MITFPTHFSNSQKVSLASLRSPSCDPASLPVSLFLIKNNHQTSLVKFSNYIFIMYDRDGALNLHPNLEEKTVRQRKQLMSTGATDIFCESCEISIHMENDF